MSPDLKINLSDFEEKIFSQNGEDGITLKLVDILFKKGSNLFYVEFGVQDGRECNSRILRERLNWRGLMMDSGNFNPQINLQKEFITKDNIANLLEKYNVPSNINLLSVDIDYNDFYILNKIVEKYICDIIIVEYNGSIPPDEDRVVEYNEKGSLEAPNYFSASLLSYVNLLKDHTLVFCEQKGVNCFFVRTSLLKEQSIVFVNQGDIGLLYKRLFWWEGQNSRRQWLTSQEAKLKFA